MNVTSDKNCYCDTVEFRNLAIETPDILTVWQLRKVVPRLEVSPSVTYIMCTDSVTLCIIWTY